MNREFAGIEWWSFLGQFRGIRGVGAGDFSVKYLETLVAVHVRPLSYPFSEDMNGECTCTVIVAEVTRRAGM